MSRAGAVRMQTLNRPHCFSLIYCLGPNVKQRFQWISPGALVGVVLLLISSLLFRLYIENFGNYEATYGSLGAIVILMLWLYVAGLVLLLGSEINVAFEKHVRGGKQGEGPKSGPVTHPAEP